MTAPVPAYGFAGQTFALLIAGRTIYEYAGLTMEHVSRLRALAREHQAQTGVPVVLAPGGDLRQEVSPAEEPVYMRLALGVVVAVAEADAGKPLGPLTLEDLRAAARKVASIPQAFWDAAARIVDTGAGLPHSPQRLREAAASNGQAALFKGIALDAAEVRDGPDGLFLVSSGPLPAADLVWGVLETPPAEEDEESTEDGADDVEGRPRLFLGQGSGQDQHRQGVRGTRVVHANYAGSGSVLVDPDVAARAAEAPPSDGAFFLIPYYD